MSVVVASSVVAGLFMAVIALRMKAPTIHPDEFGFIFNGQVLIGRDQVEMPTGSFYPAGYGLVTGLGYLVTGSMAGTYTFALLANLVMSVLLALVAHRLAVEAFGASRRMGLVAASMVFVAPATIVSAMFSWAETASRLMFMVFVLMVFRASRDTTRANVVMLSLFIGFMPVLHGRFTLVLAVTGALLMWWWVRRALWMADVSWAMSALVAGYLAAGRVNGFLRDAMYTSSFDQESRLLSRLTDPSTWPSLLRSMLGQGWYMLATTLGLFAVSVGFIAVHSWRTWRRDKRWDDPAVTTMVVLVLSALAVWFTSGLQLMFGDRGDHVVYGRYVEMFIPAFLVVACVGYERMFALSLRLVGLSAVLVLALGAARVFADGGDAVKFGHSRGLYVFPNAVGTDVARYFVDTGLVTFSLFFAAATLLVWLASRWLGPATLVLVVVFVGVGSIHSGERSIIPRTALFERSGESVGFIRATGTEAVGFDKGLSNDRTYYYMRYQLHPIEVVMLDRADPDAEVPPELRCVFGWPDSPPNSGEWSTVASETALGRVLWQRVGTDSC